MEEMLSKKMTADELKLIETMLMDLLYDKSIEDAIQIQNWMGNVVRFKQKMNNKMKGK